MTVQDFRNLNKKINLKRVKPPKQRDYSNIKFSPYKNNCGGELSNLSPLSVNEAWKGKRYKSDVYKAYEKAVLLSLGKVIIPKGELKIQLTFGLQNILSDFDNPVKPFVDILQKKYKFNDKMIMEATIKKNKVQKGCEYIEFLITALI